MHFMYEFYVDKISAHECHNNKCLQMFAETMDLGTAESLNFVGNY